MKFPSLYGLAFWVESSQLNYWPLSIMMGIIACCSCEGLVEIWFMVFFLYGGAIRGDFNNNWLIFIMVSIHVSLSMPCFRSWGHLKAIFFALRSINLQFLLFRWRVPNKAMVSPPINLFMCTKLLARVQFFIIFYFAWCFQLFHFKFWFKVWLAQT